MRARHRHFNPRSAGSSLVLDSRYIQQTDDTAINNWSDRSGNENNASQATAANQPRFRTNIQGGNPTVRFDGSNDFLSIADSNSLDASTWISMHIGYSIRSSRTVGTLAVKRLNDGVTYNYGIYSSSLTTTPAWGERSTDAYATLTNLEVIGTHYIFNYQYKKNSFSSYRNGLLQTTSSIVNGNVDLIPNNAALQIGNGPQAGGNPNIWPAAVDINYLYVLTSEINSSLRRRLEHASAYSFKIACS